MRRIDLRLELVSATAQLPYANFKCHPPHSQLAVFCCDNKDAIRGGTSLSAVYQLETSICRMKVEQSPPVLINVSGRIMSHLVLMSPPTANLQHVE
jgi:hypothetical protein